MVDAGDSLVSQLEDVFYGSWWCHELLIVQRRLDLEHLLVLAGELDRLQRQGDLVRGWPLTISQRCHRIAPLLYPGAISQGLAEADILLEWLVIQCILLVYLQRHAGLGVGGSYGLEEAL